MPNFTEILLSIIMGLPFYCPIWLIIPLLLSFIYAIKHQLPAWSIIQEIFIIPLLFWINIAVAQILFEPPSHHFMMIIMFSEPFTIGFSILLWLFLLCRIIINKQKPLYPQKYITRIIWCIFLTTTIICNAVFLPDMIQETKKRKILDAVNNGDIKGLQHLVHGQCPNNQINTPYLISLSSRRPNMAHYLLTCFKETNDSEMFSTTLINLLTSSHDLTEIQQDKLISEILTNQYSSLTLKDKQRLIKILAQSLASDMPPLSAITLYLITQKKELSQIFAQNLPQLSNEQKANLFKYGDKEALTLMQIYKLDSPEKLYIALLILTHQNSTLQELLTKAPDIIKQPLYYDKNLKHMIFLETYSFQYGDYEIITYLLDHKLINPTDYNDFDVKNKTCNNLLDNLLFHNQYIDNTKQKNNIKQVLKSKHACNIQNE